MTQWVTEQIQAQLVLIHVQIFGSMSTISVLAAAFWVNLGQLVPLGPLSLPVLAQDC